MPFDANGKIVPSRVSPIHSGGRSYKYVFDRKTKEQRKVYSDGTYEVLTNPNPSLTVDDMFNALRPVWEARVAHVTIALQRLIDTPAEKYASIPQLLGFKWWKFWMWKTWFYKIEIINKQKLEFKRMLDTTDDKRFAMQAEVDKWLYYAGIDLKK